MNESDAPESKQRLGDFEIIREIGRGGMGRVYEALQVSLNRRVALKVFSGTLGLTPSGVKRFQREAEAAAKLHHTNIVPVYATGEEQGIYYYAMDLVEGPSLRQVIEHLRIASGALPPSDTAEAGTEDRELHELPAWVSETMPLEQGTTGSGSGAAGSDSSLGAGAKYFEVIARMIADVADALEHTHKRAVIHRDVKPSNLLLSADGRLSLNDFGLARVLDQPGVTLTGEFVGSPLYMSPEQVAAGRVPIDHRTDIYSLGATFYELLTLQPPFPGQRREQVVAQILQKEPRRPRRVNRKVPVDLETICLKALEKDPDRRYQTAAQMAEDLRRYVGGYAITAKRPSLGRRAAKFVRRNRAAVGAALAIIVLSCAAGITAWKWYSESLVRQALEEQGDAVKTKMPRIRDLLAAEKRVSAFQLAEEVQRVLPDHPEFVALWKQVSVTASVETDPPGALVEIRDWRYVEDPWTAVGETPLREKSFPRGLLRWRFTREGHAGVERLARVPGAQTWRVRLQQAGELPPGMVRVEAGTVPEWGGIIVEDPGSLVPNDFLIDKYEVTNQQFQRFVDANAYRKQEYWQELIRDVREAGWEEAVARLQDATKKPGPSTWAGGTYPSGEDRCPVRGVSWYEAAAYARFAGKQLPTIHHWGLAASIELGHSIVPLSNYSNKGPAAVGANPGISRFGAYDMAGNVKEWCWNTIRNDRRCMLGGAWSDASYMFVETEAYSPFERLPTFGFRCAEYLIAPPQEALSEVLLLYRDFSKETPATVAEFEAYRRLYSYDKQTLPHPRPEPAGGATADYWHELVRIDLAPEKERLILHLFLPRRVQPPYQTIVFVPGLDANIPQPFDASHGSGTWSTVTRLAQRGRAVVLPVFKGIFERHDGIDVYQIMRHHPIIFRNYVTQVSRELSRTIDYLETREKDFARDKFAYAGRSFGALFGPVMTAVEDRFRVCVLIVGAFGSQRFEPEIDPFNFAPHVHVPVLMLNGRYDNVFLYATEQVPLYRYLGSPADQKRHEVLETGHWVPEETQVQYTHDWLDRFLGPVTKR